MHKLSKLALLAVAGGMTLMTPALAAPPTRGPQIDCSLPANAANPFCLKPGGNNHGKPPNGNGGPGGAGPGGNGPGNHGPGPGGNGPGNHGPGPGGNGPGPGGNGPGPGGNGPGPGFPGGFNFSQHDRDQFHQRFGGMNFGFSFGLPNFSIQLGVPVPRAFSLKPVPRSIYRYYPQFRGYLFFETRRHDIVIVSPKTHKIVAVL